MLMGRHAYDEGFDELIYHDMRDRGASAEEEKVCRYMVMMSAQRFCSHVVHHIWHPTMIDQHVMLKAAESSYRSEKTSA